MIYSMWLWIYSNNLKKNRSITGELETIPAVGNKIVFIVEVL